MDSEIVQILKVLLALEKENLNREAQDLKIQVEKNLEELINIHNEFVNYGEDVSNKIDKLSKNKDELFKKINDLIKKIMDDEKRPDQRKEEIAENLRKEMKPIEILLEQVKSRADKVGIFKKHEIPKLPDNFLKFYNFDQLTKTYRDWYTEKIKESAGLIPGLGNAISLLSLMNTIIEIPTSLPDFNSAVQNLGQLFIIKLMNNNYSNFILPKIKLDYKNLKMQIDYIYNLDIELDSDIELTLSKVLHSLDEYQ